MLRRPPGEGRHVVQQAYTRKYLWALAAFLLPVLPLIVAAESHQSLHQQPHPLAYPSLADNGRPDRNANPSRPRHESPLEGESVIRNLAATALTHHLIETPHAAMRRFRTNPQPTKEEQEQGQRQVQEEHSTQHVHEQHQQQRQQILHGHINLQPYDASALSSAAPDSSTETSVRAPSSPLTPATRSIEDWEVEDFVLLATIDGDLYASDRLTGKERWHISLGQPMVETKRYRQDKSVFESDSNTIWDRCIWAIEPTGEGEIYMFAPGKTDGLMATGLTMKALVEKMSPYENKEYGLVYTGKKETKVLALDAATGRAIRWFGPTASTADDHDSCPRPLDPVAGLDADEEECHSSTITLGRTEYTVGISNPRGYPVATLKFSEWSPNSKDDDLMRQYSTTIDKIYVASRHDGRFYGFDLERDSERPIFVENFPNPVAKAFDIIRPTYRYSPAADEDNSSELVALPQPALPAKDPQTSPARGGPVFLNQLDGNWYAMSARAYPLTTKAPVALLGQLDWDKNLDSAQLSEVLVGQHFLGKPWPKPQVPLLPGSSPKSVSTDPQSPRLDGHRQDDPNYPTLAIDAPNPSSTVIERVKKLPQDAANSAIEAFTNPFVALLFMITLFVYRHEIIRRVKKAPKQSFRWTKGLLKQRGFDLDLDEDDSADEPFESQTLEGFPGSIQGPEKAAARQEADTTDVLVAGEETLLDAAASPVVDVQTPSSPDDASHNLPELKKKKAHRGRRGGKQHRKNKKVDPASVDHEPLNDVEEAVNMAKRLGETTRGPEPDIQTVPDDVGNVSVPILRIDDSLEVIQEQQLGTGSNGTVVFAGKWQDRPVAVKRMLRSFYDIATRETRLLREVDLHPNVIRYYAQLERGDFIYIALQLCDASLADVVEKPSYFKKLAQAGSQDPLGVLKQITKGLDHLHSLQIVHRDLKPQNILITTDREGEPLILVSDFGLCKKLENGQSSLGATTAHNAGTAGWRAPELLHDDDASSGPMLVDASSTHSGNASSSPQQGDQRRRVTRSIDIFSLGIVFFYVLTQGSHPFDCGGSFMREVNIRKGTYSLDKLEVLGEYQREAKHLVETMISANPKKRPKSKDILMHPFFWPAEKRLNFLCDVSDAFERESRDPPSVALQTLEKGADEVISNGDFLSRLHKDFVDSLGKQRKYTGSRMLDLLRALRNKKNHYRDMPEALQKKVGRLDEGYLLYWTTRFPDLLLYCWAVVEDIGLHKDHQLQKYYELRKAY